MNKNWNKKGFKPPGFKPPGRVLSQDSYESASQPTSSNPAIPTPTIVNDYASPSMIWDSQASQPISEDDVPDWAKELPTNSDSFLDQTIQTRESNQIDVSIFDDVLRKTLDGEKTKDGKLVADVRPGVEVTNERPTIWSREEILNRLSQATKSSKSSQNNNSRHASQSQDSRSSSQIFENSQPRKPIELGKCLNLSQVMADMPGEEDGHDSPDFDAFNGNIASDNEENDGNELIIEDTTHRAPVKSQNSSRSKFEREEESVGAVVIDEAPRRTPIKSQNSGTSKFVQKEVRAEGDNSIIGDTTHRTPVKSKTSSRSKFAREVASVDAVVIDEAPRHTPIKSQPSGTDKLVQKEARADAEVIQGTPDLTPIKSQASSKSRFEELLSQESDDSDREFDAIDQHVFSQVMGQLDKNMAAGKENEEDGETSSVDSEIYRPETNGNHNNINKSFVLNGTKSLNTAGLQKSKHTGKPNYDTPRQSVFGNRALHKSILKKNKNIRKQFNAQAKSKNHLHYTKPPKFHCSLKKKLLDLRKLRNEGVWVECCNTACKKWRYLKDVGDPAQLPNIWVCNMNLDSNYNECNHPEQSIKEVGDKLEAFVECNYTVGSVVWARVVGHAWWPAMVDDDPDTEEFFWTDDTEDHFSVMVIPAWYHVVFFDQPNGNKVERAWVRIQNLKRFKHGDQIPTAGKSLTAMKEGRQKAAIRCAELSLDMDLFERRKKYCFTERYQGKWGQVIDWEDLEEDTEEVERYGRRS